MYAAWFRALKDGQVHHINEIKEYIKEEFKLTDEEIAQKLPSGKQSIFANRVGWAKTYLKKAGLIESPVRGKCVLTKEGKRVLPQAESINNVFLMKYSGFQEFTSTSKKLENIKNADDYEEKSPLENFEKAYHQINDTLADELMEEVMALAPVQFEKLIVGGFGLYRSEPLEILLHFSNGACECFLIDQHKAAQSISHAYTYPHDQS